MEFLAEISKSYPIPTWLSFWILVANFAYFFSKLLILIVRFVDKTNATCKLSEEMQTDVSSINKTHIILIEKFNNLVNALYEKKAIKNPTLFSVNSPLSLTSEGMLFVDALGWGKVVSDAEYRKTLFSALDKIGLKTKYDVEKYCTVILSEYAGSAKESPYTPVKKYLYEHANIDDTEALMACSIFLRDKYLEAHPEIKD